MDEPLLDAIARAPDDEGPRLVYADALSARQDPHGELIVVQHELARGRAPGARELERLRFRERELILAVCRRIGLPAKAVTFERGFVSSLTLTPFLPDVLARAFAHPAMRFVRSLTVGQHDAEVARTLAGAPFLPHLRSLSGRIGDILGPAIEATAGRLDELSVPIDVLPKLVKSRLPLVRLTIGGDAATLEMPALGMILRGEAFPTLRHLKLDTWRGVDAGTIETLARSPLAAQLESLAVNFAGTRDAFVRFRDAFAHVELVPLDRLRNTNASALSELGAVLLELGRPERALEVYEAAHVMQCGQFDAARFGIERALAELGSSRAIDGGDPSRDRDPKRLAGLMVWSAELRDLGRRELADLLLGRVLAASPDHAGAWAARAAARPDDDVPPLGRALASDGDHLGPTCVTPPPDDRDLVQLATAYSVLPKDPRAAIAATTTLREDVARAPEKVGESMRLHLAIVTAFAELAVEDAGAAAATLDALEEAATCPKTFAVAWLARGFVEHARGDRDAAFVAWRRCIPPCFSPSEIAVEIAEEAEAAFARRSGAAAPEGGRPRVHTGDGEPYDQMACSTASIFAAQLVGMGDSAQARRDEIAEWLASFGPLRPSSGLVFVPMIARTARVFPALGLEDVDGVLDLFAGLPGWRFRPRTAEYWRRR